MRIFCDGSFYPKLPDRPGFAAFTALKGNKEIKNWGIPVDVANCFEAEFMAIINALQWAIINGRMYITIVSDSQPVISALTAEKPLQNQSYESYRQLALLLASQLTVVSFKWVPRWENKQADKICRQVASKHRKLSM